ncbi:winged helix-turn-helix domain-containing protein [Methanosarcina sp. KYL-1]|uniref:helix-turn-helix transcriptional regulator n=1 Tax=Methanosarcina sp. KYL-1 TaxID=2602068 RepID=UPI0021017D24|nr:winged helix-turn-helix domain-containing protein [Methanosarcina sp. KYL-1]MCQ1536460.1 winged helix-turn-helix domain-containing protein [Methanosarcina sp. KYL-1]
MEKTLIDLLFMSQKRKDLLLLLKDGSKTIEEIVDALQVNPTGMLPQIKKLKDDRLVLQEDREYMLAPIAKILVERMEPLLDTLEVIEEHEDFWQERDLRGIPRAFLGRFNELKPYSLVKPDPDNIFEPPAVFMENVRKSKDILAFSSIFHPIFPGKFLRNEEKETEMTLIVTEGVFSRLETDFKGELDIYLAQEKKKLFVCSDEIKIGLLTKTERFMLASFLTAKGTFDQEGIISLQPAALQWTEDLILHYMKQSREIRRT